MKIFRLTLPCRLKYVSIPALRGGVLHKNFLFVRFCEVSAAAFFRSAQHEFAGIRGISKMSARQAGKCGERNRMVVWFCLAKLSKGGVADGVHNSKRFVFVRDFDCFNHYSCYYHNAQKEITAQATKL